MSREENVDYETLKKIVFLVFVFSNGSQSRIKQKEVADKAGVSQQTVSRILQELENKGLIERRVGGKGEYVLLTEQGSSYLKILGERISNILYGPRKIILKGKVISGLGEGGFYVSLPYYSDKIKEILGQPAYPGTLNVELDKDSPYDRLFIEKIANIYIPSFSNGRRTYGSAKAIKCSVNGYVPCAIIIPSRTHHPPKVIEVVSPAYLRGELGLKDGDEVFIEIVGEDKQ